MAEMVQVDIKTVEYMDKLQVELDKLKYAILSEDFESQFSISREIEKTAIELREYQDKISDSK